MPELPDVAVYVERIQSLAGGQVLDKVRIASPFLVRTFDPLIHAVEGATLVNVQRLGKQIVLGFDNDLYFSIHLMIAGRLHWKEPGAKIPGKVGLAGFDFASGTMTLTEASSKKRAAVHVVRG